MKAVVATMTGTIIDVPVKVGDTVNEGDDVAILESMKMQMPIAATEAGTVQEIKVEAGDFVNEGDTILVLA